MKKPILIQGAMTSEVAIFRSSGNLEEKKMGGYSFFQGEINGVSVVISETKIGMANAAAATALAIVTFAPRAILNQGIAGAHQEDLNTGDIILGGEVVSINSLEKPNTKEGVDYKKWEHFDFFQNKGSFLGDGAMLSVFEQAEYTKGRKIKGILGTGDVWNREAEYIRHLVDLLHTACEDMESLAVAQVAREFALPMLGIRIISNNELQGTAYDPSQGDVLQQFIIDNLQQI
ncbi:MAG: 5'-methylthioadenosine/S-adenosylhomocysteine nucleosidase [Eubacteriales bacterium]